MVKFSGGLAEALILYVRTLAWWQAPIEELETKVKRSGPAPKLRRKSRLDLRTESGGEPDLPEIPAESQHIVSLLFEIGPTSAGGMSTIPLTWVDIATWQRLIGVELTPWQVRLLRRLSGEYLESYHAAEKQDAPPPWQPQSDEDRRARIATHVRSFLRGAPR